MRRSPRRVALAVSGAVLAVGLIAAAWIRIPYYAVGPGPARNVTPMIRFDGPPRYDPAGAYVMTTVRLYQLTPLQAIGVWLDPNWSAVSEDVLYPPGTSIQQEQTRSVSEMDQSKIDAVTVVLSRLANYPEEHGAGALVESTVPGCPADGELFPGDVIVSIDGQPIASRDEASAAIGAAKPGESLDFRVLVDGDRESATFARERCSEGSPALIGVSLQDPFPFDVSISSGDVGGPSAGLMFALAFYDLMTPGDLSDGRVVAGTGTISADGEVGPIGAIRDKVIGAEDSGASLFLVPAKNWKQLRGVDTGDMKLARVQTFDDALQALQEGDANAVA